MLRYKLLCDDVLEMIGRIEEHGKKVGRNFKNLAYYDSTLMRLQVIGESIKKLPKEVVRKYPEVDWNVFVKFREVVSHNYFRISHRILNNIIDKELPGLKIVIKDILEKGR